MGYLYRGVSKSYDDSVAGKLVPKGNSHKVEMKYNDGSKYDQIIYGESEINAARAQQIDSGMHNNCFISTTRSFDEAKKFATTGNMEDGYIYVIDESLLESFGVVAIEFKDPEHPRECEVSLRSTDCGELPSGIVIDKIDIEPI